MNISRLGVTTLALAALLASCGGGGSTPPVSRPAPTSPATAPTSAPTGAPIVLGASTTTATGTVVNDADGSPLGGERVVVMPFGPCGATPPPASITPESDGCPTPLPSPQVTTAPNGTFSLGGVPSGHYLLVIGTDSTSTTGTISASVHDNITLTGGTQALKAPSLPTILTVTLPTWETNGDYRIATLNATTEVPCFQAWQTARAANNVAASSVDEWLIENARALETELQNGGGLRGFLTSDATGFTSMGAVSGCPFVPVIFPGGALATAGATDPRTVWFGARFVTFSTDGGLNEQTAGAGEFPIDPRSFTDPNVPIWR
jgi:hypothetical protein